MLHFITKLLPNIATESANTDRSVLRRQRKCSNVPRLMMYVLILATFASPVLGAGVLAAVNNTIRYTAQKLCGYATAQPAAEEETFYDAEVTESFYDAEVAEMSSAAPAAEDPTPELAAEDPPSDPEAEDPQTDPAAEDSTAEPVEPAAPAAPAAPADNVPKWDWSNFMFCDINRSVTQLLRPWINHYDLSGLNGLDEVIKEVTNGVLGLLETEVLKDGMITPMVDLFMTWVDSELDISQRKHFFKTVVIPNVESHASRWDRLWMNKCQQKTIHTKIAKKMKEKVYEYHEIAINKLSFQRNQPIQQRLRDMHSASTDNAALDSEEKEIHPLEGCLPPLLVEALDEEFADSEYKDTDGKLQTGNLINYIIEDVDRGMRRVMQVVKQYYKITDVPFDVGNFWSKVLRNLLEPFVGLERYRLPCQGRCKTTATGPGHCKVATRKCLCGSEWFDGCGGDGLREGTWRHKRNKTCNACDGTGFSQDTATRVVPSILYLFRDATVLKIMGWVDTLPEDQREKVVTTILGNADLGWKDRVALNTAGLWSSSWKRDLLEKGINAKVTSKIDEYVAILGPQVTALQVNIDTRLR